MKASCNIAAIEQRSNRTCGMYAGYDANTPLAATDHDKKILQRVSRLFQSPTFNFRPQTSKQHQTILMTYIRFCLAYGHEPYTDKGISTDILIEYVVFLGMSGIKSIGNYISMGPRILCENADATWIPIHLRPKLKRTMKTVNRVYGVSSTTKAPHM